MDLFVINANALVVLQKEDGEAVMVKGGITADGFEVLSTLPQRLADICLLQGSSGYMVVQCTYEQGQFV